MTSQSCILTKADLVRATRVRHDAIHGLIKPKPRLNIWQYAEQFRYVAKGVSAKTLEGPRLYSTADAPHQKRILEAPTDPEVQTTILIGASQVMGKTEIFNNVLAYHME